MRVMNETSNLEELMNVILEQVIDMIPNADSGTFLMLNEAEGIFAFQAARGWDLELVKQIRIPVDRTILTQEPINEPTIVSGEEIEALDKRLYSPEIVKKFKEMRHPKSSIIVPVHIDGEVVGYFNINNKTAENAFDEEDLKVIEEIRDEITLVIKNIRLAEERENSLQELQQRNLELSALYAIASTVSGSLDLDAILGEALEKAMELMKMDAGGIFLREKQDLTLATYAGISPESAKAVDRMKLGEGVIGQVAQSGEPIVIQNLAEDPRVARQSIIEKEDLKTFIAVPLQSKDRIVGVFGLAHRVARLVTGEERQLLMAIGHQIGVVIENVKLFEQVKLAAEELEQRVKERTAELQIANEELETFVYSVSHHLKAPLRTLEGFSELLLEDRRDRLGEQGTAYLERIQTGALRMGKLIHGLLAYAQIGRSERTFLDVDMESLVKGCVKDLHSKIEAADARVEMPGDLPTVRGDPILLTPLVTNLLNNALTYCRDGVPPRIEVGWEERAEEHVFSIRDNGIGIEKRFWDRVFQPFKQLHLPEDYPGIGIGLAIARRVIEVHGGRIWVESKPDKGSTFYFTLPTRKTG
ncbi:MAG: GAF domain-containing protein [Candidatus Bipolaricaulia bacterium]